MKVYNIHSFSHTNISTLKVSDLNKKGKNMVISDVNTYNCQTCLTLDPIHCPRKLEQYKDQEAFKNTFPLTERTK